MRTSPSAPTTRVRAGPSRTPRRRPTRPHRRTRRRRTLAPPTTAPAPALALARPRWRRPLNAARASRAARGWRRPPSSRSRSTATRRLSTGSGRSPSSPSRSVCRRGRAAASPPCRTRQTPRRSALAAVSASVEAWRCGGADRRRIWRASPCRGRARSRTLTRIRTPRRGVRTRGSSPSDAGVAVVVAVSGQWSVSDAWWAAPVMYGQDSAGGFRGVARADAPLETRLCPPTLLVGVHASLLCL
mmetsp:Transcript_30599/g.70803  ORF Transcript_30599/g.70803 Transcript_30599/m.70803 type:complete len:244 (-) Transcript_30599:181-912(-)